MNSIKYYLYSNLNSNQKKQWRKENNLKYDFMPCLFFVISLVFPILAVSTLDFKISLIVGSIFSAILLSSVILWKIIKKWNIGKDGGLLTFVLLVLFPITIIIFNIILLNINYNNGTKIALIVISWISVWLYLILSIGTLWGNKKDIQERSNDYQNDMHKMYEIIFKDKNKFLKEYLNEKTKINCYDIIDDFDKNEYIIKYSKNRKPNTLILNYPDFAKYLDKINKKK